MAGGMVGVWGWEGMGGQPLPGKGVWGVGWRGRGARGRGQEMMLGPPGRHCHWTEGAPCLSWEHCNEETPGGSEREGGAVGPGSRGHPRMDLFRSLSS